MNADARPAFRSAPAPVSAGDYRTLAAFRRSLRSFLYFSEQAARAEGLTPAQHQLLLAVKGAATPQPPTIGDIAESLKLRHHSAVELVDRAVSAGLVERRADPHDGRCQHVALTTLGETKLSGLSTLHRQELKRFREEIFVHLDSLESDTN